MALKSLLFCLFFSIVSACPFCDLAVKEKQLIFEGEKIMALYALNPMTKGHVLLIPKRHVERFEELSSIELEEIKSSIQQLSEAFPKAYGATDYFIMQKNGVLAGQSVPHLHIHVFPTAVHLQRIVIKSLFYNPKIDDEEMRACIEELKPFLIADKS